MMKVSTKSTYAIKALIDLARNTPDKPQSLSIIAERQNIPLPYLEQIFSKLKKGGIVQAVRGPQGGYQLTRSSSRITLEDIVTTLEGPIEPVLCSQPQNRSSTCHDVEGCVSRVICNELDGALYSVLRKNTLSHLCGEADRLQGA